MKRSHFAFGCAVQALRLPKDDDINMRYKDFFYKHFEWTTIEGHLKWHKIEQKWVSYQSLKSQQFTNNDYSILYSMCID